MLSLPLALCMHLCVRVRARINRRTATADADATADGRRRDAPFAAFLARFVRRRVAACVDFGTCCTQIQLSVVLQLFSFNTHFIPL